METNKLKPVLMREGRRYRKDKLLQQGLYQRWRCLTRRCRGAVKSRNDVDRSGLVEVRDHDEFCVPDPEGCESAKKVSALKKAASEEPGAIPALYNRCASALSAEPAVAARFPQFKEIDSSLYRSRKRNYPRLPGTADEIELPDRLKRSVAGEEFFRAAGPSNEWMIFATDSAIRELSLSTHWCCDGTFKTVPTIFAQLYSFHYFKGDKLLPAVYVLMTRKTKEAYKNVLRALKDLAQEAGTTLTPALVTTDFEISFIETFSDEFPNSSIRGCFFHHTQAIWRNVQKLGLVGIYGTEKEARLQMRKLMALAFLPIDQVVDGFNSVQSQISEPLQPLFDYYKSYWLGRVPLAIWNMHGVSRRTNNNLEAWHGGLLKRMGKTHSNIYEFLQKLIEEQGSTDTKLAQLASGNLPYNSRNVKYLQLNQRIESLHFSFANGELSRDRFIAGLAHSMATPTSFSL